MATRFEMSFSAEERELLIEAAAMLACYLETGDPHLTRDDMRNQGRTPPPFDLQRLQKADAAMSLFIRLGGLGFRG